MSHDEREQQITVGSEIKVKRVSTSSEDVVEEHSKCKRYLVVKIKASGLTHKCTLQSIKDPNEIVKLKLNTVEWKFAKAKVETKKRKHKEESNQEFIQKQKKQKDEESLSLLPIHPANTASEIIAIPRSFHFKRSIPNLVLKYICAPMVGASELAFRLLVRRYGATLAYTPMINSERFAHDEAYRKEEFQTNEEDRPLVAHFCANNPDLFLQAVKHVEHHCDAIDLNLGCPQRVAYSGHFGSFLLDEVDRSLVLSLVRTIAENSIVPIFVKIRLLDTIEDTLRLCQQLVGAGASLIAIHGRYRVNLVSRTGPGARDGPAHLDQIKTIRQQIPSHIPIIANGNIITWEDIQQNLQYTACNGVMSAEGLLDNPAIFNGGKKIPSIQLAKEYLALATQYPVKMKTLIFHIRRICKNELTEYQLMEDCLSITSLEAMKGLIDQLEQYLHDPSLFHFNKQKQIALQKTLELKQFEENKRKLFEERMIRKAKREKRSDLLYYLQKGAEVPTIEIIQQLKVKKTKEEAFAIWKEKHSQHCWDYHFGENGCGRDRKCSFLHMDPRYVEEAAYG